MASKKVRLSVEQKAEIDTLVKKANQRLREIEKQGFTREYAYREIEMWQGRKATFLTTDKQGRVKFRTDVQKLYKANPNDYYKLKDKVSYFLELKTSKVKDIKKKYEKATASIKENYKIELTPEEQKDIFGSALWDELMTTYNSDEIVDLAKQTENAKANDIIKIMEQLKEGKTIYELEEQLELSGSF